MAGAGLAGFPGGTFPLNIPLTNLADLHDQPLKPSAHSFSSETAGGGAKAKMSRRPTVSRRKWEFPMVFSEIGLDAKLL